LERPDKFDGNYSEEYNVLNWVDETESYLTTCDVDESDWPEFAKTYLGKRVRAWWAAKWNSKVSRPQWETVKQEMVQRWLPKDHTRKIQQRFETTHQGTDTLFKYVDRFQTIAAAVHLAEINLTDDNMVRQFIRGLVRESDRRFVLEKEPANLDQCYKAVDTLRAARELALYDYPGGKPDTRRREHQLNKLDAEQKKEAFKKGNCIGCGKPGHWVSVCPDLGKNIGRRVNKEFKKAWNKAQGDDFRKKDPKKRRGTPPRRFTKLEGPAGGDDNTYDSDDPSSSSGEDSEASEPSDDDEASGNEDPESEG
jgi:hypothetical protein